MDYDARQERGSDYQGNAGADQNLRRFTQLKARQYKQGQLRQQGLTHKYCLLKVEEERPHSKELSGEKGGDKNRGSNQQGQGLKEDQTNITIQDPPKDTKVKSKKINDIECTWCDRCKHWTKGEKKHLMEQHKTKAKLQTPQANIVALDFPTIGGMWMSQFFH